MSNSTLTGLENELYPAVVVAEQGMDTDRVKEIAQDIGNAERGIAQFVGQYIPEVRNSIGNYINKGIFYIKRLARNLGGVYNPSDDSLEINHDQSKPIIKQSVVHEIFHRYQNALGAMKNYTSELGRKLGRFGEGLAHYMTEGTASLATELYTGEESMDGYDIQRAGAVKAARKHGFGTLLNPPKDKIMEIAQTFYEGMVEFYESMRRPPYALAPVYSN